MQLREMAHARTGDKGDTCQISVIAYDAADYGHLAAHVTVERVSTHFARIRHGHGPVTRYELAGLGALIFVLEESLGTGVTRSLAIDAHGKCLSATLLALEIPDRVRLA
jgi:hypothetical protein